MRWNYYKLRQLSLLQSVTRFITKCDGYYKVRWIYYKLPQVLQSNNSYNLRQYASPFIPRDNSRRKQSWIFGQIKFSASITVWYRYTIRHHYTLFLRACLHGGVTGSFMSFIKKRFSLVTWLIKAEKLITEEMHVSPKKKI